MAWGLEADVIVEYWSDTYGVLMGKQWWDFEIIYIALYLDRDNMQ